MIVFIRGNLLRFLLLFSIFFMSSYNLYSNDNVLIMNSYHKMYNWTSSITESFIKTVSADLPDTEFYVEYMDTKLINTEEYYRQLFELYSLKYKHSNFDLILASDDSSFKFLLKYGDTIFPDVPVVFCGVNSFSSSMLANHSNFTGILEDISIKETIDIALQLFPETRFIYSVGDSSFTAQSNIDRVRKLEGQYHPKYNFLYSATNSLPIVMKEISRLPDNSIILYLGYIMDIIGGQYNVLTVQEDISEISPGAVFSCWDFTLNHGIVGGMITNGVMQGESAGSMAIKVLSGISPSEIPVITKSPNKYIFDKNILDKFNLKISDLPKDSIVINNPVSFYTNYKRIILSALLFFVVQSLIIFYLLYNFIHRRKAQKDLADSDAKIKLKNSLLQSIMNSPPDINILSVDRNFCYTFFNNTHRDGMKRVWGCDIETGHNLLDYLKGSHRPFVEDIYKRTLNGETITENTKNTRLDGSVSHHINYSSPIHNEKKEIIGLTVYSINITKRKIAEDMIQKSLKEKEILLKEIHHRVKNNLQIISSMLNLQESKIIDSSDRALFIESINRIDSISLIHELLYTSEDLSSIDMQIYFSDLVSNINNTIGDKENHVNVIFKIEKVMLNVNIAVPLGIISNELITNSFKHAFTGVENPEIIITIQIEDKDLLYLKIEDNGSGFDPAYDKEKPGTLGFELVNALTQQINGIYDVNIKSEGLEFLFRIPYGVV